MNGFAIIPWRKQLFEFRHSHLSAREPEEYDRCGNGRCFHCGATSIFNAIARQLPPTISKSPSANVARNCGSAVTSKCCDRLYDFAPPGTRGQGLTRFLCYWCEGRESGGSDCQCALQNSANSHQAVWNSHQLRDFRRDLLGPIFSRRNALVDARVFEQPSLVRIGQKEPSLILAMRGIFWWPG